MCHFSCGTCSVAGNTNCLSCPALSNRSTNPIGGKCDCQLGFYENLVTVCAACDHSC